MKVLPRDWAKAEETENLYRELLQAVESKRPGETRHETALRYIQERESTGDLTGTIGRLTGTETINSKATGLDAIALGTPGHDVTADGGTRRTPSRTVLGAKSEIETP